MKKRVFWITLFITVTLLIPAILALVNIDFNIKLEDRFYYPNETIPVNISVTNRDTFTAKDAELALIIGQRTYTFDLGNIKRGETFKKEINLPEFPPGTYTVKGVFNYTGLFDKRFFIDTYNSFDVRFPEIERFPRNINIVAFELPEKMISGKSYEVSVTVRNDGEITGNILIEVGTLNESVSEETTLNPGESKTIKLTATFHNPGVSLIEAKVYALVGGEKYLLTYLGKTAFIQEEKLAKLSFDKIELVNEADNQINQEDEVNVRIYTLNSGDYAASNVKAVLSSPYPNIQITKSEVNYNVISPKESFGGFDEDTLFKIKTNNSEKGEHTLNLDISYIDSSEHNVNFEIPIMVSEGKDSCDSDKECNDNELCSDGKCMPVVCECGYVENHKCVKYQCCEDSDCPKYHTCNKKLHICKPPRCSSNFDCRIDEVCSEGKCKEAFNLVFVPINWKPDELDGFVRKVDIAFNDFISKSPFSECSEEKRRIRLHIIKPEDCQVGSCEHHCSDCNEKARLCVIENGFGGFYDKYAALTKASWRGGCAAGIPGDGSSTHAGVVSVTVHEIGHSIGLCHVEGCGARGACMHYCPNKADCNEAEDTRKTFVMDYCAPMTQYGPSGYNYLKTKYEGESPAAGGLAKWLEGC